MIDTLAKNLVELKTEFANIYDGTSQFQEIIPKSESSLFPITSPHLKLLHKFAKSNPIYYNSFEKRVMQTDCIIYEGDINRYWLNSIKHGASQAPFSPTWMMSGFIISSLAQHLGYTELIDIGSGDGRIAFCGKALGVRSHSIEIDDMLIDLQRPLCSVLDFDPHCSDAGLFDYSSLNLSRPIFFIGGLAQMGGTSLASGVLDAIQSIPDVWKNSGWVFAGTASKKYAPDPKGEFGWGTFMEKK